MSSTVPQSSREWNLYRAFLSLAQTRSMEAAASELGISLATMRRRMERLESLVGAKLAQGSGKDFELTFDGKRIFDVVAGVDEELSKLVDSRNVALQPKPRLAISICTSEVLQRRFWFPLFAQSHDTLNNVDLYFETVNFTDWVTTLKQDLMISPDRSLSPHHESEVIGGQTIHLGAHKNYIDRFGAVTHENMHEHRFLRVDHVTAYPESNLFMDEISARCRETITLSSADMLDKASEEGLGFCLTLNWLEPFGFQMFNNMFSLRTPLYFNYRTSLLKDPTSRAFVQHVKELAREKFEQWTPDYYKAA